MNLFVLKRLYNFSRDVAFLLLLSVGGAYAEDYKIAVAGAPKTFDSRKASDAWSVRLLELISYPLVEINEKFEPSLSPAVKDVEEFGNSFKLTLNPISFHDGSSLNSLHVKNFYESIRQGDIVSPLKGQLKDLNSIQTPDDKTVIFEFSRPQLWFWRLLDVPFVKVSSDMHEKPVGLGMMKFLSSDDYGNTVLERNDGDTFTFQVIKNPMVRLLKALKGEVDIVHGDMGKELFSYGVDKGLHGVSSPSASYTYVGFNLESSGVRSLDVRKALAMGVNIPEVQSALLGEGGREANSLLLSSHPAYWPVGRISYNPEKAVSLLEKEGFTLNEDGERLRLTLSITTNPFVMRLAQILKEQWSDIGVNLEISSSEWGSFYSSVVKGQFQMFILTWVGKFDVDIYELLFHSAMIPPDGANRGRFKNAMVDSLIESMMSEVDVEKRNDFAAKIQKILAENMVYLPLWRRDHVALLQSDILGYEMPTDGGYSGVVKIHRK